MTGSPPARATAANGNVAKILLAFSAEYMASILPWAAITATQPLVWVALGVAAAVSMPLLLGSRRRREFDFACKIEFNSKSAAGDC